MTDSAAIINELTISATEVAKVCHQVNKAYCMAMGDNSQLDWDNAPDWQKQSLINGVLFHVTHPQATPENSHENWLKEKTADGWTYGAVKDTDKKTHPCFLPYNELPEMQRAKDYIFRSIVHALYAMKFGQGVGL